MYKSKGLKIERSVFPIIMTAFSLIFFLVVYSTVNKFSIKTYYYEGLIFALPLVCFSLVSVLCYKSKINAGSSAAMSISLAIILSLIMLVTLAIIIIDSATAVVTDIESYDRVKKLSGLPDYLTVDCLPNKIPDNAEDIMFRYNSAFGDIALKYKADEKTIKTYAAKYKSKAKWIGKADDSDASKYGVIDGTLNIFDYSKTGLPEGYVIYIIYSRPYHPNDWNHGERSLVAIDETDNEILFLASRW